MCGVMHAHIATHLRKTAAIKVSSMRLALTPKYFGLEAL